MNNVVLIGRLTKDPDLRYLPNTGTAVANFTLAVDRNLSKEKRAEAQEKGQAEADFIRIVAWGKLAENVANFTNKGRLVAVTGRIQTGSYVDKDGKKVYTTEVFANYVEFLEWGNNKQDDTDYLIDGFHEVEGEEIPF